MIRLQDIPAPSEQFTEQQLRGMPSYREANEVICGHVFDDRYKACRTWDARRDFDGKVEQESAMARGYQHNVMWDEHTHALIPRKKRDDDRDYIPPINLCHDYVRTELGTYASGPPKWTVVPTSGDDNVRVYARTCTQYLNSVWDTQEMARKVGVDLLRYRIVQRVGFIKTSLDRIGIAVQALGPASLYWDWGAKRFRDALWCVEVSSRTPDDIYNTYGIRVKGTSESLDDDSSRSPGGGWFRKGFGKVVDFVKNPNSGGGAGLSSDAMVWVLHLEYWEKPSPVCPQGKYIVVVGDRAQKAVILYRPFPFRHGELPYVDFPDWEEPDDPLPSSTMFHLIPIQQLYNRQNENAMRHAERLFDPRLLVDRRSNINPADLKPGSKVVNFDSTGGAQAPRDVTVQPLAGPAIAHLEMIRQQFTDVSGQPPAVHGQATANVRTYAQQAGLTEAANRKRTQSHLIYEVGMQRVGRQILMMLKQFGKPEELLPLTGENGSYEYVKFIESTIPDDPRVKIQIGSSLNQSVAEARTMIMELLKSQFVPPDPQIMSRVLEDLGFDWLESLVNSELARQDADMAREMDELKQGSFRPARVEQDHGKWVEHLTKYMATTAFNDRAMKDPMWAKGFYMRKMQHLAFLQNIMDAERERMLSEQRALGQINSDSKQGEPKR